MNKFSHTTGTCKRPQRLFIWGYPLEFSLSPFFQEHASFLNSERIVYSIFRGDLEEFRKMLCDDCCIGANITVSNKVKAIELCDELTETAKISGSVNTVFKKDGKLVGDNTDGEGLYLWLTENVNTKGKTLEILGNGGTARSVASVFNRNGYRVKIFGREEKGWEKNFGTFSGIDDWKDEILTVNTLPFLKEGKNVINISYHFGKISENAAGMLACQGWLAFKRWFNTDITLEQFIKITFLQKTAVENTALIKRLCTNEI